MPYVPGFDYHGLRWNCEYPSVSNVQTFLTISGVESEDFGQALVGSPVDPATNVDRIPIPAGLADSVRRARERAYSIKQLR